MKRNYLIRTSLERLYFEEFNNEVEQLVIDYFRLKHNHRGKVNYGSNINRFRSFDKFLYNLQVAIHSNINSIEVDNIDKRGSQFHLDHIIPISYGFNNGIDYKLISHKDNLQILTAKDNMSKGFKMTDKAKDLLSRFNIKSNPTEGRYLFEPTDIKTNYRPYIIVFGKPRIHIEDDKFISIYNLNTAELIKEIKYR